LAAAFVKPTMPALHWAATSAGLLAMNIGEATVRTYLDRISARTRTHRLGYHPLGRKEGQARSPESRVQGRAEVRPCDRPDGDHHSGREQVGDCDQGHGFDAREQDDEHPEQELRHDERGAIADSVSDDAPHPFEREHPEAEHCERNPCLVRARSQLPKLQWDAYLQQAGRQGRKGEDRDEAPAAAADQ